MNQKFVAVALCATLAACTMSKVAPSPDERLRERALEIEVAPPPPTSLPRSIAEPTPPTVGVAVAPRQSAASEVVVSAKPLLRPPPVYPEALIEEAIEGRVTASFVVDAAGRVGAVKILRSSHPEFAEAVRVALKRWRFAPARLASGQAVASQVRVPFSFRLEE